MPSPLVMPMMCGLKMALLTPPVSNANDAAEMPTALTLKEEAKDCRDTQALATVEEECYCTWCRYSPVCICAFLAPLSFAGM